MLSWIFPVCSSIATIRTFRFSPTREQLPAGGASIAVVAGDDKGSRGIWIFPLTTS